MMDVLEFCKKYHNNIKYTDIQKKYLKLFESGWRFPKTKVLFYLPRCHGNNIIKEIGRHHKAFEKEGGFRSIFSDVDE